jgi:RNA polymerase sigma-70 factor (ECF subfamily)
MRLRFGSTKPCQAGYSHGKTAKHCRAPFVEGDDKMALASRTRPGRRSGPFGATFAGQAEEPGNVPAPLPVSSADTREIDLVRGDFNALVRRYEKQLFNVIYQWIGDYDEAADLTQDTFFSAYKARQSFRGDARVYTWLYRIAHNHCKNRFKQRDRQRQIEGPSLDAGVGAAGDLSDQAIADTRDIVDWSLSPSKMLESRELRAAIDRAVNALASEYRVVLVLREFEDLSYNDIAEVTGLTLEAVKTRLNRARAMVRQRVEPYLRQ